MPDNGSEKFEVRVVKGPYKNTWVKVLPNGRMIFQGINSQTGKGYGIGLPRHVAHNPKLFEKYIAHYMETGEISPIDMVPWPDDAPGDAKIIDETTISPN